jgi:hypothetical protein
VLLDKGMWLVNCAVEFTYRGLQVVEGAEAEVYTVVIMLAIVLVYTDSHNTMVNLVTTV